MAGIVVTGATGFIGKALMGVLAGAEAVGRGGFDGLARFQGAVCVHLAGSPRQFADRAAQERERSDALRLAEKVLAAGFSRIVLASSSQVYGDSDTRPIPEAAPLAPRNAYGRLKLELEGLFAGHALARLTNVYGSGMAPGNVFSDILAQLAASDEVRVRDLAPVRDYLHVSDAAAGLAALAASDGTGPFNVGSGRGVSVSDLVRLLADSLGRRTPKASAVQENPIPSYVVLDSSKLTRLTGWRPRVTLEEGVKTLIEVPR